MSDEEQGQSPNALVRTDASEVAVRPKRAGLAIEVYVRRNGKDSGGNTSRHDQVVVMGTVDCSNPTKEPTIEELAPEFQFHEPSDDEAPAVWLVKGWENKGGPYLVPEKSEGVPDMSRKLRWGYNLASTSLPVFWLAVGLKDGTVHALRIFDTREAMSFVPPLDIA